MNLYFKMAQNINILDLPDLALHNICCFLTDPFDLVHFGNTCRRLRSISMATTLWWPIIFKWFDGIWIFVDFNNQQEHPRDWLLKIFQKVSLPATKTELKCTFNEENWVRADSPRFRCLVGWLQVVHPNRTTDNPAILYEKWMYDIGLYHRTTTQGYVNYTHDNFQFSDDQIHVLSKLGQAADRDLRRRKQPYKDERWYIEHKGTSTSDWKTELFPVALATSTTCPFVMCPFQDNMTDEKSGLKGLSVSLSIVLAKFLKIKNKYLHLHPSEIIIFIQTFCTLFQQEVMAFTPNPQRPYKSQVLSLINGNSFNIEFLQAVLTAYKLNFSCRDIITEFTKFASQYKGIDFMVDKVRDRFRKSLYNEIDGVLFVNPGNHVITRVNLTDSDLIGGNNSKQEMAAAAFISEKGVLVTWHLIGRMRF